MSEMRRRIELQVTKINFKEQVTFLLAHRQETPKEGDDYLENRALQNICEGEKYVYQRKIEDRRL